METVDLTRRLESARAPRGDAARLLTIGGFSLRIEGLDGTLATELDQRWGAFLSADDTSAVDRTVSIFDGGGEGWLPVGVGEAYRLESFDDAAPAVVSYNFAMRLEPSGRWRVGIRESSDEPLARALDNVTRVVTAELAVADGGFAMHSAGTLVGEQAYHFAGPSGAGKSTALGLMGGRSLGDDFGFVRPTEDGWSTAAVPFDNSECIREAPPAGWMKLAGIWRLFQDSQTEEREPEASKAMASLLSCVAFPWALPSRMSATMAAVHRFASSGRYRHLHFEKQAELGALLAGSEH
jgi:hypothetical protein